MRTFIDNEVFTLREALKRELRKSNDVAIAVPFIDQAGLTILSGALGSVARRGQIRMIVGLSQDAFNSPASLKLLLNLSRNYPGRFHVRVSRFADRFHEKMYLMKSKGKISTILGSSNLTKKGLTRRSEMNILITEERGETLLDSLWKYFDRNFYKNSVPLSSTIVRRYARHARQARQARGRTPRKDWSWLESKLRSRRIDVSETGRTWFDELRDDLPSSVSRKVDRETGWNHDSSVSIDDSPALIGNLRVGDRLALLESKKGVGKRRRRFISMNLVVDRAEVPTSIYRHFVEFKQMTRRRVTSSLDESLEPIWSKRNQPLDRSRTTMLQKFFQSG